MGIAPVSTSFGIDSNVVPEGAEEAGGGELKEMAEKLRRAGE